MAESSLSVGRPELQREIGRFLGYGNDPNGFSSDETTNVDDFIFAGLRRFYGEYEWSFLKPVLQLTLTAGYATGTIEVVEGVVTLTGGTFPTWAAQGVLVSDSTYATVASRDSGTQITLDDTSIAISSGSTYNLEREAYDLPDDYAGLEGEFTYQPNQSRFYPPIRHVGEAQLRSLVQGYNTTYRPRWCAVRPKAYDQSTGQRWEVLFWPRSDGAYVIEAMYKANPDKLTSSNPYPLGGREHAETIVEACLAVAESRMDDEIGVHSRRYQELVAASIARDKTNHIPEYLLGRISDSADGVPSTYENAERAWFDDSYIRYNGGALQGE